MKEITTKPFRDPILGKQLIESIKKETATFRQKQGRKPVVMEVCGTHTVSVSKAGLRDVLGDDLELLSGPGCPVCVTGHYDIDYMIELGKQEGVIICTFGDMIRVPGSYSTLAKEQAEGHDIRVVYSPIDALDIAAANPGKKVIFLGVGFETTTPAIAATIEISEIRKLANFYVYTVHKVCPPVIKLLFQDDNLCLDGLLLPGHVAAITGRAALNFIAADYNAPAAVAGFEPLDVLAGILDIIQMLNRGEHLVTNQYLRVVTEQGNIAAQQIMQKYFMTVSSDWRGMGDIADSGLELRPEYQKYDARKLFDIKIPKTTATKGCRCGEVLSGHIKPSACGLFATKCTPIDPVGPCMVSYEGTCATYYKYERKV